MWQFYVFLILTVLALWGMARKLLSTPYEVTESIPLTAGLFLGTAIVMAFGLYLNWTIFATFGGIAAGIMFGMHLLSSSYYMAHMLMTGQSIRIGFETKIYSLCYSTIMTVLLMIIGFTHVW